MFGNRRSRKHQAERLAGQAWENLSAAVDSAGSTTRTARSRAAGLLDDTSDRVGTSARRAKSGAKEARRRANAAYDALAGRKPRTPWGTLAAFAVAGAALGWLAGIFGKQLGTPREEELIAMPEDVTSDLLHR